MATWQQVKSYIYANYNVSNDNGDMLTLLHRSLGHRARP